MTTDPIPSTSPDPKTDYKSSKRLVIGVWSLGFAPVAWLVGQGLVAAAFFSSTFILNRAMSLGGGHWAWSASLRYGYMAVLLVTWLGLTGGPQALVATWQVFRAHARFWLLAGTIGFGLFYALLTFAADYAPGWIVASTWQFTILATPLVLPAFGKPVPRSGWMFSILIFVGILLVNLERATGIGLRAILFGVVPVLFAAFAYPIGNQMVGEARSGTFRTIPHITDPIMHSAPARVLLMTLGSIPFWLVLVLVTAPPPPSTGQLVNTAMVALLSGVIATSVFLHARHSTTRAYEVAAVDATQAAEAPFSLLGEIVILGGALPGLAGASGLALIVVGLVFYALKQQK